MAIIFRNYDVLACYAVFYGGQRSEVGEVICADNYAASMYAHLPVGVLQFGIFEQRAEFFVRSPENLLEFIHVFIAVGQIDFWRFTLLIFDAIRKTVGDGFLDFIHDRQGHLLNASHIRNGRFRLHCVIRYNMRHVGMPVFF